MATALSVQPPHVLHLDDRKELPPPRFDLCFLPALPCTSARAIVSCASHVTPTLSQNRRQSLSVADGAPPGPTPCSQPLLCFLVHSAPATLVSWLVPQHARCTPALGPRPWLFPLPGFPPPPDICAVDTLLSLVLHSNVTLSRNLAPIYNYSPFS